MKYYRRMLAAMIMLSCLIFFSKPSLAGFEGYWVAKSVSQSTGMMATGKSSEISEEITYYKDGKVRHELKDQNQIIITRTDLELVWMIDKVQGTYTEMKFEDMKASMQMAKNAFNSPEMQTAMEDMTPEQREMIEKMTGRKMGKKEKPMSFDLRIEPTGKKETISGEKCEIVNVFMGENQIMQMWLSDKYDIGKEFYKTYERMGVFSDATNKSWENMKGFPMKTVVTISMGNMGSTTTTSTIEKVVKTSVSDSQFELPKGLKKTATPMMNFKNK